MNTVDYGLSESRNGKQERQSNKSSVSIFAVADKDYKFLDFSEQFPDPSDEFDWRWLPLGLVGFMCFLSGIIVVYSNRIIRGMCSAPQ